MTNATKLTLYLWVTACALLVGLIVAFCLMVAGRWVAAWCAIAAAFAVAGAMAQAESETVFDMEGEETE